MEGWKGRGLVTEDRRAGGVEEWRGGGRGGRGRLTAKRA